LGTLLLLDRGTVHNAALIIKSGDKLQRLETRAFKVVTAKDDPDFNRWGCLKKLVGATVVI